LVHTRKLVPLTSAGELKNRMDFELFSPYFFTNALSFLSRFWPLSFTRVMIMSALLSLAWSRRSSAFFTMSYALISAPTAGA